jgi:hypothetical protein
MDNQDKYAFISAQIDKWPSKNKLANIFKSDGFEVTEGKYSIRLEDFEHFVFRDLGGDLSSGCITADHESAKELVDFSGRVSQTLGKAGVRHRFEVYSENEELVAYMHYDWPKD